MRKKTHELQGYTLVLNKIVFVTAIFNADDNEGAQFNVGFGSNTRIPVKYPNRADATLARSLLIQTINKE